MSSVLIVDDDIDFRFLLATHFESRGWAVLLAGSGEEALNTLGALSQKPNLIITDQQMGQVTGIDILNFVNQKITGERIPVIVSSGDATLVAPHTLSKPYSIEALDRMVDHLVH